MKIIVCIKEVPDTAIGLKIRDDSHEIETENIPWIMNPYDEYAIEEAQRLKEKFGGDIAAITVGNERVETVLRSCIALGADRAIRIKDDSLKKKDSLITSKILAEVIRNIEYDVILCGKESVDYGYAQTGQMIAEFLQIPCVSAIKKLEVSPSTKDAMCHREIEGGLEVVKCSLPAVFTAQKGLNVPRYASLSGIMKAKKMKIEILEIDTLGFNPSDLKPKIRVTNLSYPPKRQEGRIIEGTLPDTAKELVRNLKEARVI
ncbi:MAG: electron transfer flavoprotein subunit beta/FixA family protein [Nitrospinae bacterium]|nr:electron transfer flavoprotein subunit beta/FixA family protein [Nitrospinota bacterium]MBI3814605.1 electron transfer flavoprotein subunit beta/FixA family protein [Nitrospinota bacterium]